MSSERETTQSDVLEQMLVVGDPVEFNAHYPPITNHKVPWPTADNGAQKSEHEMLLRLSISEPSPRTQSPQCTTTVEDQEVAAAVEGIRTTSSNLSSATAAGGRGAIGTSLLKSAAAEDRPQFESDDELATRRISMTSRDHQWIERIQLLQTAVADSLNEDYYYQMNFLKKYGYPPASIKVVPSDSRPYETPLASDRRVLGRLNVLSSSHPRQLIELDSPENRPYVKADPFKAALLKIEKIYEWLLDAQAERQKRTFSQYQGAILRAEQMQKVLNPAVPLEMFLSPDLPNMLSVARGRRLIIHLLPIVSDLVSYLFHILSAVVHTGQALDRDTYKALLIPLLHLPINQLLVLVNILVQSKMSALSPLLKTRFGLTLLLRLSLLCSGHLWPLLATVAAAAATQASDPSGGGNFSVASPPAAAPLNVHPQLVLLRQFLQKICQLLQPVETRHLQIPFEPVHQLAVTFQRVLVASATACHQSATGVIPSGVLAKLEYLEARSLDEQQSFVLSGLSLSVRPWISSTQVGSYRAPWPAVPTERTR